MCGEKMDVLNKIAGKIDNYVRAIGMNPCKLCEGLTDYRGNCMGYSWDITYFPSKDKGCWNFSLYCHRQEIWYITTEGTIVDIMLAAYEKLISGEWKEKARELVEEKERRNV